MSRFKGYRGPKRKGSPRANAVPCLVLLAIVIVVLMVVLYSVIRSS